MTPRPFTVLGGFLGAGKTTLVNRILRDAAGTRYAVLVNDFGSVNVDAGLIAAHDGQTIALTNGCICCSLSDGFVQTMLRLMQDPGAFDHVIVEASGVAEPGRIMDFARLDPLLAPDAILTLVDADAVLDRLADPRIGDIVARQIAEADILLLNKTDLVGPAQQESVTARLRGLNRRAPILACRDADLDPEVLLGTGLSPEAASRLETHGHAHEQAAPFHAAVVRHDIPVGRDAFRRWAEALPGDILRGKGRVALTGEGAFVWQRVGARETLTAAPQACPGTEIVLIGTSPIDPPPLSDRPARQ